MNLGENIHNAFQVVFETYKSIEKLIQNCNHEYNREKYYMPADRFMRNANSSSWEGFCYWSFILLYQRKEDGPVLENGWINAPVYAVEISVDSDTCEEPMIYIAKMDFNDLTNWGRGCSNGDHEKFYDAIHAQYYLDEIEKGEGIMEIRPKKMYEEKVADTFWGLEKIICSEIKLVDVTKENYKEKIIGEIERLKDWGDKEWQS